MKVTFNRAKAHRFMSSFICSVLIGMVIVNIASCEKDDYLFSASGTVVDSHSGLPIAGAGVADKRLRVSTNSKGEYKFQVYTEADDEEHYSHTMDHFFVCEADGYETVITYANMKKNKNIVVNFTLRRK